MKEKYLVTYEVTFTRDVNYQSACFAAGSRHRFYTVSGSDHPMDVSDEAFTSVHRYFGLIANNRYQAILPLENLPHIVNIEQLTLVRLFAESHEDVTKLKNAAELMGLTTHQTPLGCNCPNSNSRQASMLVRMGNTIVTEVVCCKVCAKEKNRKYEPLQTTEGGEV